MKFVKAIFRVIIGALFGIGGALALSPAIAAFTSGPGQPSPALVWGVVLIGALLGFFAPTIRRAFGRGFLLLGVSVFALPLSVMMLSGRLVSDMVSTTATDSQAATAVGAGIGGALMTGAAGFIGFFFGSILIIVGLVLALGGRREVVVVNSYTPAPATGGRQEPRL